jgi:hypothetical protein
MEEILKTIQCSELMLLCGKNTDVFEVSLLLAVSKYGKGKGKVVPVL